MPVILQRIAPTTIEYRQTFNGDNCG